jgi:hypothetical protein
VRKCVTQKMKGVAQHGPGCRTSSRRLPSQQDLRDVTLKTDAALHYVHYARDYDDLQSK